MRTKKEPGLAGTPRKGPKRVSLRPAQFEEAITGLIQTEPPPKGKAAGKERSVRKEPEREG